MYLNNSDVTIVVISYYIVVYAILYVDCYVSIQCAIVVLLFSHWTLVYCITYYYVSIHCAIVVLLFSLCLIIILLGHSPAWLI